MTVTEIWAGRLAFGVAAWSTARTATVCVPGSSVSDVMFAGGADAQLANTSPSIEHSKSAVGSLLVTVSASGVPSAISVGGVPWMATVGASTSTIVHSQSAGASAGTRRSCLIAL